MYQGIILNFIFKEKDQVDVYDDFGYKSYSGTLDFKFNDDFWWIIDEQKNVKVVEAKYLRFKGKSRLQCCCGITATYKERPEQVSRHAYWCEVKNV